MPTSLPPQTFVILVTLLTFSVVLFCIGFVLVHITKISDGLVKSLKTKEPSSSDAEKTKEDAYSKANRIIDDAKASSLSIIADANEKAKKVLKDANQLSEHNSYEIDQALHDISEKNVYEAEKTSQELLSSYKDAIETQSSHNMEVLEKTSQEIEKEAMSEIDSFKGVLEKKTLESEKAMEQRASQRYSEIEHDLEEYKNMKMAKIDKNIYKILAAVTRDIVGNSMSMTGKEEAVMSSLSRAKTEITINSAKLSDKTEVNTDGQ